MHVVAVSHGVLAATFEYNPDGLRTSMTVNGMRTNYLWDVAAGLPVIISDTSSVYVYGLGLIARQTGAEVEYYHTDALGSVRNLTNGSGQNIGAYSFGPFGEPLFTSAISSNPFRYTGQQSDSHSGLYYLRARYVEPGTGRFLTRDPFRGYPEQPQTLNLYVYVSNSPLLYTDPSGYFGWDEARRTTLSFVQGLSDQFIYDTTLGGVRRAGFGYDESSAYQWGRFTGRQASTAWAATEFAVGVAGMGIGAAGTGGGGLLAATGLGAAPGVVLAGASAGVFVAGAGAAGHGLAIAGRNIFDPIAFKSSGNCDSEDSAWGPYDVAKAGGKHSGLLKNYEQRPTSQIQDSVESFDKQVRIHQEKINNPSHFVPNWANLSEREQAGLIAKWQRDLARNQEEGEVLRGLLRERGALP